MGLHTLPTPESHCRASWLWRPKIPLDQTRERITLSDNDFLDLDWSYAKIKTNKLIILLHGLEGNAQRLYVVGVAKQFNDNKVDALNINFTVKVENKFYIIFFKWTWPKLT